jgi:subtilisin family serine protease
LSIYTKYILGSVLVILVAKIAFWDFSNFSTETSDQFSITSPQQSQSNSAFGSHAPLPNSLAGKVSNSVEEQENPNDQIDDIPPPVSKNITARWPNAALLESQENFDPASGEVRRVSIIKVPELPSPIRVIEQFEGNLPPGESPVIKTTAMAADRILVKLQAQALHEVTAELSSKYGITLKPFAEDRGWYYAHPPSLKIGSYEATEKVLNLVYFDGVTSEPDYLIRLDAIPDDTQFDELWGLQNTDYPNFDINAPEGWDIQSDARSVVVAVIDTGIRYTHQDLQANMWMNPGEVGFDSEGTLKQSNGVDDDDNGLVDDVYGYNAINETGDPNDDHYHGTHVAGTIGASGNNATGIVGVAWNVQLMALKFLGSNGSGFSSDAIQCIDYAIQNGADVMNNSWGGGGFSLALTDAIESAQQADIIFVAAAGNDSTNNEENRHYPSSYSNDNIVSVASIDKDGDLSEFSNFGSISVDIAAPGRSILSTGNNFDSDYRYLSGTSMATPHVSGILALLKARYPAEDYQTLINRLLGGAQPDTRYEGQLVSGRRCDLYESLVMGAVYNYPRIEQFSTESYVFEGSSTTLSVIATGDEPLTYQWYQNGEIISGETSAELELTSVAATSNGDKYRLVVSNPAGRTQIETTLNVYIPYPEISGLVNSNLPISWWKTNQNSWITDTTYSYTGDTSAMSANIGDLEKSQLFATVEGLGTLFFHSRTSTGDSQDYLEVKVNGVRELFKWGDKPVWSETAIELSEGSNVIEFVYRKGRWINSQEDSVWIDNVTFTPLIGVERPQVLYTSDNLSVLAGGNAVFFVQTDGTPPLSYQWFINDILLEGATGRIIEIGDVASEHVGSYHVVVSNFAGQAFSSEMTLSISSSIQPPVVLKQPQRKTITASADISIFAEIGGTAPIQYQWKKDGVEIPNATSSRLTLYNFQNGDQGFYTLEASNAAGTVESLPAALSTRDDPLAIFVDQTALPGGTGATWESAFNTIGEALAVAEYTDSIWVANGIYAESLECKVGVSLYGGFSGLGELEEASLDDRDWLLYTTVINASLSDGGNSGDHVFRLYQNSEVAIDGFFITGGHADGEYPEESGGGLMFFQSRNCRVSNCAIYACSSARYGGGISLTDSSQVEITNCFVVGNTAPEFGGGIRSRNGSVIDCRDTIVVGNTKHGIHIKGAGDALDNVIICGNRSDYGAAIDFRSEATPVIRNSHIVYNHSTTNHSVVSVRDSSNPVILNTIFANNTGIGIYETEQTDEIRLESNLFFQNSGGAYRKHDGQIFNDPAMLNGMDNIENTIIADPMLLSGHGGTISEDSILLSAPCWTLVVDNSKNWNAGELVGRVVEIDGDTYSVIISNEAGNFTVLGDVTTKALSGATYQILNLKPKGISPAIDQANNVSAPTSDILGNPRPVAISGVGTDENNSDVDIGVFELAGLHSGANTTHPVNFYRLSFEPSSINFGEQNPDAGATSPQQLLITNTSSSNSVTITGVSIADGSSSAFSVSADTSEALLATDEQRIISIDFDPDVEGEFTAYLKVRFQEYDEKEVLLPLFGKGAYPSAELEVAPLQIEFSAHDIALDDPNDSEILEIFSVGELALDNIIVSLTGNDASDFSIETDTGESTLSTGAVRTLILTFQTNTTGHKTALLKVESSDADEPSIEVVLQGEGIDPTGRISVSPSDLLYEIAEIGESLVLPVLVANIGDDVLTISSLSISGPSASDYSIIADSGEVELQPLGSRMVSVEFTPSDSGVRQAVLTVNSDDPIEPVVDVSLRGRGFGGTIYYVDLSAPVGGDGSSWNNAFQRIQDGINATSANDQVWVARGVYYESIQMAPNVEVYGSFTGLNGVKEQALAERLFEEPSTFINGSLADHVVDFSYAIYARLDGFCITGGHANGTHPHNFGGGALFYRTFGASSILSNSRIYGNWADRFGGGIYIWNDANPILRNVIITRNQVGEHGGGVAFNESSSSSVSSINFSMIIGNSASRGGAIYYYSDSRLENSIIAGNFADHGSALYGRLGAHLDIWNATFHGNYDASGIFYLIEDSSTNVYNTIFSSNSPRVFNASENQWGVFHSLFADNDIYLSIAPDDHEFAGYGQGLISGDPRFYEGYQGSWTNQPIYNPATGTTLLTDRTAMFLSSGTQGRAVNLDLSQSLIAYIYDSTFETLEVLGDWTDIASAGGQYQVIDFHLQENSPAIGTSAYNAPFWDYEMTPRFINNTASEIGALEHFQTQTSYDTWRQLHYGGVVVPGSEFESDPTGRGVSNAFLYLRGLDPFSWEHDNGPQIQFYSDSGQTFAKISFLRRSMTSDSRIEHTPYFSEDLSFWSSATSGFEGNILLHFYDGMEQLIYHELLPADTSSRKFIIEEMNYLE